MIIDGSKSYETWPFQVEYIIRDRSQLVDVNIEILNRERTQKIRSYDAQFSIQEALKSKNMFIQPSGRVLKDMMPEEEKMPSETLIQLAVKERKREVQKRIRFVVKGKFTSLGLIKLKMLEYEAQKESSNVLFLTKAVEIDYQSNRSGLFNFGVVDIDSAAFREGKLGEKSIFIQVLESVLDKKGQLQTSQIGSHILHLKDILSLDIDSNKQFQILNEKKTKPVGHI